MKFGKIITPLEGHLLEFRRHIKNWALYLQPEKHQAKIIGQKMDGSEDRDINMKLDDIVYNGIQSLSNTYLEDDRDTIPAILFKKKMKGDKVIQTDHIFVLINSDGRQETIEATCNKQELVEEHMLINLWIEQAQDVSICYSSEVSYPVKNKY